MPLRQALLWSVIATIIVADQVTKFLVVEHIPLFGSVTVIPDLLNLVHIYNAGVAFGFLNDLAPSVRTTVTTALALGALGGILYYARHVGRQERLARVGLSLILGGAVGNLIDRLRLGHVIDFVDVYWGDWHFWAFNVADAAITCGAALLFLQLLTAGRHASHPV